MRPSIAFVEKNYPSIRLYGGDKDGFAVNISFSRERDRDNNGGDLDWVCSNVSLCLASRALHILTVYSARFRTFRGGWSASGARRPKPVGDAPRYSIV